MTPTNAEFNGEFNDMPLKIHVEAKIAEKKQKKETFGRENLSYLHKISQFIKRKFIQSEFK